MEAGLAAEVDAIRRAVAILYFTGQRIGDAVAMRWPTDGIIRLTQQKTGNRIPDSYLKRFLPSQDRPQDTMPADIAAFVRSITGEKR